MDTYIEMSVTKRPMFKDRIISFIISVLPMFIGVYLVILVLFSNTATLLMLSIVICALLCWLSYKIYCSFNVDWEYSLVGDELRFAKIINKSKRREILTVSIPKATVISNVNLIEHNSKILHNCKKYSFISQTTDEYYYISSFDGKGHPVCVFFEPDERMKDSLSVIARGRFFK